MSATKKDLEARVTELLARCEQLERENAAHARAMSALRADMLVEAKKAAGDRDDMMARVYPLHDHVTAFVEELNTWALSFDRSRLMKKLHVILDRERKSFNELVDANCKATGRATPVRETPVLAETLVEWRRP